MDAGRAWPLALSRHRGSLLNVARATRTDAPQPASAMAPDSVEAFISSVKKHPILYDCKRLGYRDVDKKREIWEMVKQETGMETVDDCQRLWKSLRDRYIRELRALEHPSQLPWETRKSKVGLLQFAGLLQRLRKSCKVSAAKQPLGIADTGSLDRYSNGSEPAVMEDSFTPEGPPPAHSHCPKMVLASPQTAPEDYAPLRLHQSPEPPEKKPVLNTESMDSFESEVLGILNRPLDEDEYFALSIVPTLRRLSLKKKALAKVKILQDLALL
ncbi:hypothetical protein HPB51_010225 [Rhipicephalus microplus]|uniref:Uncharacterized protein n=1 Tax=Rhipicephalus microplus TaxID=6941 RepID=A0A9J6F291_RHIMP|nr:hypothetical protein HPB51_010225 [Rhipicephalus microplus]